MTEKGSLVKVIGGWPSPFVMRTRIALNFKSVDYEFVEDMMNPKSELLLKSNPVHKKIPVLIHDEKPVNESLIIVQYIDEVWSSGPSILPSDPCQRAIQRFWASYIDDKWYPSLSGIARAQNEEAKATAIEQVKEGITLLEEAFVTSCQGKAFFGGDNIEYLDIAFGCFLGWINFFEKKYNMKLLDATKTPGISAWAEKFCAHDAVKGLMPEPDKLVEFAKIIYARYRTGHVYV